MDAFDDGVGRDDDVFAECFENGRVIGQPKRARIGGQRPEVARDQGILAGCGRTGSGQYSAAPARANSLARNWRAI